MNSEFFKDKQEYEKPELVVIEYTTEVIADEEGSTDVVSAPQGWM